MKDQMSNNEGTRLREFLKDPKKMDTAARGPISGELLYGGKTLRESISGKPLTKSMRLIREALPDLRITKNGLKSALDYCKIPRQRAEKKPKKSPAPTPIPTTSPITIDKVYELLVTIHNQNTKLAADYAWQQEKLDALLKVWDLKVPARGAAPVLPGMEALVGSAQQQNH